jgi:hypothetical protein
MEIGTTAILNDITTDRVSLRTQNLYIEGCYTETLGHLYWRKHQRLIGEIRNRVVFPDRFSAEVAIHEIWSPVIARFMFHKKHTAIPWLLLLSREASKFVRRNERRGFKKPYRLPEAATISDFMLRDISGAEADVFRSYYLDGGDYLEIAHVVNLPPLQVSQTLANTRDALQRKFQYPDGPLSVPKGILRLIGIKGILAAL